MSKFTSGSIWLSLCNFIEVISIFTSIPINILLLYCIFKKSPKQFGEYKYLMAWFSIQSIFFIFIAAVTHMCFHTLGGAFMMFTVRKESKLPQWVIWGLLGVCCVSIGLIYFTLAVQFIYRYFAMVDPSKLQYFSRWRKIYWIFGMIIVSMIYGGCGFLGIKRTPNHDLEIRKSMADVYKVAPNDVYYLAVEYFTRNENRQVEINWRTICVAVALNATYALFVFAIVYCGVRTYQKMCLKTSQLSNHMNIQKQLFMALLVQTLIPTVLIFIPCVIFYVLPIFEIPLGENSNVLSISLVLYPMIDPVGVLYNIQVYRKFIKRSVYRRILRRSGGVVDVFTKKNKNQAIG